jgi:hypothetical protein
MPQYTFIIGAGRSGSSILHELLGYHPEVGWMSHLCDAHPLQPERNRRALEAMRLPLVGGTLRRWYEPHECYRFFDVAYPGFSAPMRDLGRGDVTDRAASSIRDRLAAVTTSRRDHLVVKITGWPRIGFLAELFPEARFIHLVRDGRAVANSLLQVPWWHGWKGPENWRFGPLPDPYLEEWLRLDRSFVALAAIEWKLIMDAVSSARTEVRPEQVMDVRYEELCAAPQATMTRILSHAGLSMEPPLARAMERDPLRSRNAKWREDLGPHNAGIVTSVLEDALAAHGYEA